MGLSIAPLLCYEEVVKSSSMLIVPQLLGGEDVVSPSNHASQFHKLIKPSGLLIIDTSFDFLADGPASKAACPNGSRRAYLCYELVKASSMLILSQLLGGQDLVGFAQHWLLVVRLSSPTLHKPVNLSKQQQDLQTAAKMTH